MRGVALKLRMQKSRPRTPDEAANVEFRKHVIPDLSDLIGIVLEDPTQDIDCRRVTKHRRLVGRRAW